MPNTIPACPVCGMENTYSDGGQYICPDCTHGGHSLPIPLVMTMRRAWSKMPMDRFYKTVIPSPSSKTLKVKELVLGRQSRHEGEKHPLGGRRSRY